MKPKVIFIDWFGTLSDSVFWGHLADEGHPKHNFYAQSEQALFKKDNGLVVPWMRGEYSSEQIISDISQKSGLPENELLEEFIFSTKNMTINPSVLAVVKRLRSNGVKVVIATDNMDSFTRWTVPSLKLTDHFDDILNSFELKALKRDFDVDGKSLFFDEYLKQSGSIPGDSYLIDDSEDKNNQVQKYGINYLKIDSSAELTGVLNYLGSFFI